MDDDATVVGAGPNGLAAAVILARAGLKVRVLERDDTIGGGTRTEELTLPGFRHDVCSAVHPMAAVSGFFRRFQLDRRVRFITPDISYAHPLDGGRAGIAYRDLERTAAVLDDDASTGGDGREGRDGRSYRALLAHLVARDEAVARTTLSNLASVPVHPATLAAFGLAALDQAGPWWNERWRGDAAPAMLSGVMAHSIQPMPSLAAAAAGMALAVHAHAKGWPVPEGGSQAIADAMARDIEAHGGVIESGVEVTSLDQVAGSRAVILDLTPRAFLRLARESRGRLSADHLPARYTRALDRFRYGNAAAKVDFALSEPVPWANAEVRRSPTVHLGGDRAAIARAEREVARGRHPDDPYVLAVQPTVVDPTRAPEGRAVLWAYTHVPRGSGVDPTEAIIRQIERFAPGFRDTILASASGSAQELALHDPNYVGGDIASGDPSVRQLLARPLLSTDPWRTPLPGVYLGSASTPPGPSVHGLGGAYAARSALRHEFGMTRLPDLAG